MRKQDGFTLIEIIATLLLVGILSVFTGLFMTTFVNSYLMVRNNSDTAMKAQMALDRMSIELKSMSAIPTADQPDLTHITYTNPLSANRTISFAAPCIYLSTPAANNCILIDNVQAFSLNVTYNNVYSVAANDVAYIDIGFTVGEYNSFNTRIFPRNRVPHP